MSDEHDHDPRPETRAVIARVGEPTIAGYEFRDMVLPDCRGGARIRFFQRLFAEGWTIRSATVYIPPETSEPSANGD